VDSELNPNVLMLDANGAALGGWVGGHDGGCEGVIRRTCN
jgi:hypothetical protein